jgi:hypothetical protein
VNAYSDCTGHTGHTGRVAVIQSPEAQMALANGRVEVCFRALMGAGVG